MPTAKAAVPQRSSVVSLVADVMQEIRAESIKAAQARPPLKKKADERGTTDHIVMDADPGTTCAPEGARSKENTSDVKADVPGDGVTGQEDANSVEGDDKGTAASTHVMTADEVGGNVATPKAKKDPPSENGRGDASPGHPSNETFNEKYSSAIQKGDMPALGAAIMEYFATSAGAPAATKVAAAPTAAAPAAAASAPKSPTATASMQEKQAAAERYPDAAEAGYRTAQYLFDQLMKSAGAAPEAEAEAEAAAVEMIKAAHEDAAIFAQLMHGYAQGQQQALQKRAEGGAPVPSGDGGGGMGGEAGGGGAAGGDIPPEVLMQLLQGGEGGGAGAPGAEGGMPGGEGGLPGGMEGGGGGGEMPGDEQAVIEAVLAKLQEAGISPEEFAAAVSGGAGGGEGGGAPPAPESAAASAGGGEGGEEKPKEASFLKAARTRLLQSAAGFYRTLQKQASDRKLAVLMWNMKNRRVA